MSNFSTNDLGSHVADPASEWACRRVLPSLGGSEVLRARYVGHKFASHAHPEFVFAGVLEGAESFRHRGRDITASAGSMILLSPFEEHTGHAAGNAWSYAAIYPTREVIHRCLEGEVLASRPALQFRNPVVQDRQLVLKLVALHRAALSKESGLAVQSLFVSFIYDLVTCYGACEPVRESRFPAAVVKVRELLDADPAANADLVTLAAVGGVSPLQLLRAFRDSVGCTPHVYRTARRLRLAKYAITRGQPLAQVAIDAGFCDQSHFARVFRRWTGSAPGRFAKSVNF